MSELDFIFRVLEIVAASGVIGGLVAIIYRMGRMTQKFEMIGIQQAAEITDLKMETEKLGMAIGGLQVVLIELAKVGGQIGRIEDRQLQEGKRLDDLTDRFNQHLQNHPIR